MFPISAVQTTEFGHLPLFTATPTPVNVYGITVLCEPRSARLQQPRPSPAVSSRLQPSPAVSSHSGAGGGSPAVSSHSGAGGRRRHASCHPLAAACGLRHCTISAVWRCVTPPPTHRHTHTTTHTTMGVRAPAPGPSATQKLSSSLSNSGSGGVSSSSADARAARHSLSLGRNWRAFWRHNF